MQFLLKNINIKNQIRNFALNKPKEEVCGLIVKNNFKFSIFPCQNISNNKTHFFTIKSTDYLKASLIGDIVCSFHSHPNEFSDCSEFDKQNSKNHNLPLIIYHNLSDTFKFFDSNYAKNECNNVLNKYLNINFELGRADCFTLIKNYYKNELKINIIDNDLIQNRKDKWFEKNNLINLGFKLNNNFNKINDINDIKKHDIIVFNYFKEGPPHHLGIYLGNLEFLHHPRLRLSCIEKLTDIYKKKITYLVRCNLL